jgi:hypothetical protein
MVGMGMIESEPEISKVEDLHKDWRVMIAGNISFAFPIIDAVREDLAGHRGKLIVRNVVTSVWENFKKERLRVAEDFYLAPIGWTVQQLNSPAAEIIPAIKRSILWDRMDNETLQVSLLVAGFDGEGDARKGHVFKVNDHGPSRQDIPGFDSIGSGNDAATYMMMYRKASAAVPLRLMLYYALEGKIFAENATGVGSKTDLRVMKADGQRFKIRETLLEKEMLRIFNDVKPRKPNMKHVDLLNSIQGKYMGKVPKITKQDYERFVEG